MSSSEENVLIVARELLSKAEAERLAGLFRLRHHSNPAVRSAANADLIDLLGKLDKRMNESRAPLRAV